MGKIIISQSIVSGNLELITRDPTQPGGKVTKEIYSVSDSSIVLSSTVIGKPTVVPAQTGYQWDAPAQPAA